MQIYMSWSIPLPIYLVNVDNDVFIIEDSKVTIYD